MPGCRIPTPSLGPFPYASAHRVMLREGSMDVLFLIAVALMFVAIVGMVVGCDQLGVRK